MSTPDTPVVDYAFWRTLCDVAEADGPSPYVVVQTHTLSALLDAHEREAAREPVAWLLEVRRHGGWERWFIVAPEDLRKVTASFRRVYSVTPLGPVGPAVTYEPEEGE